jgi:O-acetyl-ADP-ribose deacetylase (regulator of RNase III)
MEIVLAALDDPLAEAWTSHCGNLAGVRVHKGSIFEVECDAVVSPANSYGFMDGGIDALYTRRYGPLVQERVRMAILQRHHGELLVGSAEIVETDDPRQPYLIAAPTMRVPMKLGADSVNPYLAARAVLRLVRHGFFAEGPPIGERVHRIAFPGMGTGVGGVAADICARQVRRAIEELGSAPARLPASWAEASEDHQRLYTDHPTRLQ